MTKFVISNIRTAAIESNFVERFVAMSAILS
jgi:hypothetical protein